MMRQRLQGIAIGLIVSTLFTVGVVFAKSGGETLNVMYDNIKIMIDGHEYVAKDVDGVIVEPFVSDGTTYLPVRSVAEALGKEVVWDGEKNTVHIFTKSEAITEDEIKVCFEEKVLKDGTLQDYKINRAQMVDAGIWYISFDVLPRVSGDINWIAGNGEISEDGWIVNKGLYVNAVKSDGFINLEVIGTGL